jgi:hypothetical protein
VPGPEADGEHGSDAGGEAGAASGDVGPEQEDSEGEGEEGWPEVEGEGDGEEESDPQGCACELGGPGTDFATPWLAVLRRR